MDLGATYRFLADLPVRFFRRLRHEQVDYRSLLFGDLVRRLANKTPRRVLEIGPRDGHDTSRLLTLRPEKLILVDLPNQKVKIDKWLAALNGAPVELVVGNIMYDSRFDQWDPFDVIWCTGVLYHNPEQLRFIRRMYDLTAPGGLLVLETATARRPLTRNENCVEIWYPPDKAAARAQHVSINVSHLPSAKAVHSWMEMIGYSGVEKSDCHRRVTRSLAADRVAYIAQRPADNSGSVYYRHVGHEFPIGRAR